MLVHIISFIVGFILIWLGSGLIVRSLSKLSVVTKISSFLVSFFILGILTSTPEIAVGITSIIDKRPQIYAGNLLGGIVIMFLFIIPILTILLGKVELDQKLKRRLPAILAVNAFPAIFALNMKIDQLEGGIMVVAYVALLLMFHHTEHKTIKKEVTALTRYNSTFLLFKIIFGVVLLFGAAHFIVEETIFFAQYFSIPAFYISLFALSLGTNLPELSLSIRAAISKKETIAIGDFLGSASANTLLFGLFTILNGGFVQTIGEYQITSLFIIVMLLCFYFLTREKRYISRKSALILLMLYLVFIFIEFIYKK